MQIRILDGLRQGEIVLLHLPQLLLAIGKRVQHLQLNDGIPTRVPGMFPRRQRGMAAGYRSGIHLRNRPQLVHPFLARPRVCGPQFDHVTWGEDAVDELR